MINYKGIRFVPNTTAEELFTDTDGMSVTVNFFNTRLLYMVLTNPEMLKLYSQISLVVLDGRPLSWVFAKKYQISSSILSGPEYLKYYLSLDKKIAVLGGKKGDASLLESLYTCRVDQYLLPMQEDFLASDVSLKANMAYDAIFVCIGSPKQDKLTLRLAQAHPDAPIFSIGAAIDVVLDRIKEPPKWVDQLGMRGVYWRFFDRPLRFLQMYPKYAWALITFYHEKD